MSDFHGRFVWYELLTTDTEAAKQFYGTVIGWGTAPGPTGPDYTLFTAGEVPVGGLMELPPDVRAMGSPPLWISYVAVDDVDSMAERMVGVGGKIHVAPREIAGVGRWALMADPQGAMIAVFKPSDSGPREPPAPGTPGRIGWHELVATDWQAAFPIYADLFGWQKAEAVDMGAMGTYQLFAVGERTIGGMFTKPPSVPVPFWLAYFNVGDIDAAAGRVTEGGGRILNGPMQVPGGTWIVQGTDPQGAVFALLGARA